MDPIAQKFQIASVVRCKYQDVERLIAEQFGFKEYSICAMEEVGNSSNLDITVDGKVDEDDQEDVDAMRASKKPMQWRTNILLNDLAAKGVIPCGEYLISVFW